MSAQRNGGVELEMVVAVLIGGCGAVATGGVILLSVYGKEVPHVLTLLLGAAIGCLTTWFTQRGKMLQKMHTVEGKVDLVGGDIRAVQRHVERASGTSRPDPGIAEMQREVLDLTESHLREMSAVKRKFDEAVEEIKRMRGEG